MLKVGRVRLGLDKMAVHIKEAHYQELSSTEHEGSILAIDTNPIDDGHFAVAGQQGVLGVYQIPQNVLSGEDQQPGQ
jgi:hypothetical protein